MIAPAIRSSPSTCRLNIAPLARSTCVNNVSLRVRSGEIFGFLGPMEAARRLPSAMMCGLLKPDSGSGTCLGYDIQRESAESAEMWAMTQKFSFWTISRSWRISISVARMYQVRDRGMPSGAALEGLRLEARAGHWRANCLGGWKQRMALAACMLHQPRCCCSTSRRGRRSAGAARLLDGFRRWGQGISLW